MHELSLGTTSTIMYQSLAHIFWQDVFHRKSGDQLSPKKEWSQKHSTTGRYTRTQVLNWKLESIHGINNRENKKYDHLAPAPPISMLTTDVSRRPSSAAAAWAASTIADNSLDHATLKWGEEVLVMAAHDTWNKTYKKLAQHWNGGRGRWGEFVVVAKNGTSSATFKLSAQNTLSRLFIPGMDSDLGSFDFANLSHSS